MFKDICSAIYQNKNILMFVSVGVYIIALYGVFSDNSVLFAFILTAFFIGLVIKKVFPLKIIIIWALIFYFGVLNTSFRIKDTDDLLDLAPINSTVYGKITTIPQKKDNYNYSL